MNSLALGSAAAWRARHIRRRKVTGRAAHGGLDKLLSAIAAIIRLIFAGLLKECCLVLVAPAMALENPVLDLKASIPTWLG